MKSAILLVLIVITLQWRCTSKFDDTPIAIINDSINAFVKKNADDPKSYEPLETILWDTVTFLQNIEKQIKFNERAAQSFVEFGEHGKDDRESYLSEAAKYSAIRDSLFNSSDPNAPAAIIVIHKCRLKNKFGAVTLSHIVFEFRTNLSIYHVYDQSTGKSKGYPGGFP